MMGKLWRGVRAAALGVYFLARRPPAGDQAKYDSTAQLYGRVFHRLWLIFGGLTAERALWRDLRPLLQPGQRLLDAGSGCGRLSRRMATLEPLMRLTLLDLSPGMLAWGPAFPAIECGAVCSTSRSATTSSVSWSATGCSQTLSTVRGQ